MSTINSKDKIAGINAALKAKSPAGRAAVIAKVEAELEGIKSGLAQARQILAALAVNVQSTAAKSAPRMGAKEKFRPQRKN